jgi:hypothetical protein
MKNFLILFCVLVLVSCGRNGKDGSNGVGVTAALVNTEGPISVDFADIVPGLACASGGISIFTFHDNDSDGVLSPDESVVKVKALCNGINGSNGTNGTNGTNESITLESLASSPACPSGGVKITSSSASAVEVCNGVNGLNGEQGLPGVQGIPGLAGSSGTIVTPVKFCATDNSTFPEYGLMIGEELFAVYWGSTPASPSTPQAFLTKLVAGNYMSTGGNNCLFTIP